MVENDECIHHILKVMLFTFMVENDECIHHVFKAILYMFGGYNNEYFGSNIIYIWRI